MYLVTVYQLNRSRSPPGITESVMCKSVIDSPLCLCMSTYWERGRAGWGSPGALTCMLGPRRLLCCWCCRWVNASLGLFTPAILAWCLRSWMSSRVSSSGCSQTRISEEWENILENHLGSYINWDSQMVKRPVYFRKILINNKKKQKPCSMKATAAFWTLRGQFIVAIVITTGITNNLNKRKISQWHKNRNYTGS